jgi:hypothetical protein
MQLIVLLEVNLFMSLFIGSKPMKQLLDNRIEIMNEYLMSSICINSIVITDYLVENEDKYEGSWIMIALISFTIFINISIVLWFMIINLKLIITKFNKKFYRYFDKNKLTKNHPYTIKIIKTDKKD